jgi:hypothetical protein
VCAWSCSRSCAVVLVLARVCDCTRASYTTVFACSLSCTRVVTVLVYYVTEKISHACVIIKSWAGTIWHDPKQKTRLSELAAIRNLHALASTYPGWRMYIARAGDYMYLPRRGRKYTTRAREACQPRETAAGRDARLAWHVLTAGALCGMIFSFTKVDL